jgi:hypothetical protein
MPKQFLIASTISSKLTVKNKQKEQIMPHISALKDRKFLKKEDCGAGILVTIKQCYEENVAKEGAPPEMKWCLSFFEQEKPMVLNSTNAQIIASVIGSEDTDHWTNEKIVLFSDMSITFQGKLVGGIRARAPRNQPPKVAKSLPATPPAATQAADDPGDDSVPF